MRGNLGGVNVLSGFSRFSGLPRRSFLQIAASMGAASGLGATFGSGSAFAKQQAIAGLDQRQALTFPRDEGSHNSFTTEWWYVTGYLGAASPAPERSQRKEGMYGFQVTFFRRRVAQAQNLQSALAAKQLLFAHAAVSDVQGQQLWSDQRIVRWSGNEQIDPSSEGFASSQDTAVQIQDWSLLRQGKKSLSGMPPALRARIRAADFSLDVLLTPSQAPLLQGEAGYSRKGPQESQFSYYYSLPQLKAQGDITLHGKTVAAKRSGVAWLDHEWSNELLHPLAVGWDWIGINLFDGSALTAFALRDKAGAALWDGGSFRTSQGTDTSFQRGAVSFTALRRWRSPKSGALYPVEWAVQTPLGRFTVRALFDAQELDSSGSSGAIYWEGLSELWDSQNHLVGRGYLEMTGYAKPLQL